MRRGPANSSFGERGSSAGRGLAMLHAEPADGHPSLSGSVAGLILSSAAQTDDDTLLLSKGIAVSCAGRSPVWLLDVDGVLNAPSPGWGRGVRHSQLRLEQGIALDLFWSDHVVDLVRRVHLEGLAEVRWSTTWVGWTHLLEHLWSLPPLATAFPVDVEAANRHKLPAAWGVVERERRPLVWTDDERIPPAGPERDRLTTGVHPALLLAPDSARGLRPADAELIEEFLWACRDGKDRTDGSTTAQDSAQVAAFSYAFGEHDSRTLRAWRQLAEHHEREGRPDRAIRAREQLVWAADRASQPDNLESLHDRYALASDLLCAGLVGPASDLLTDTLARCHGALDAGHWLTASVQDTVTELDDESL
jgi:hypothetical protein